jgi:acetyl esterase/lipase
MAECLTKAGACVVAVNYALAPFVTLAKSCANTARRWPGSTHTQANAAARVCAFMWAGAPRVGISQP